MIYADTSCLLKVLRPEPLSEAVWSAIDEEASVIVSVLAELETLVQLKADWTGGMLSRNQWRQAETRFGILRNQPPFEFRTLPGAVFQTALRQHRNSGDSVCRRNFGAGVVPFGTRPPAECETRKVVGFSGCQTVSRPVAIGFCSASLRPSPLSIAPTFPAPPGRRR